MKSALRRGVSDGGKEWQRRRELSKIKGTAAQEARGGRTSILLERKAVAGRSGRTAGWA